MKFVLVCFVMSPDNEGNDSTTSLYPTKQPKDFEPELKHDVIKLKFRIHGFELTPGQDGNL